MAAVALAGFLSGEQVMAAGSDGNELLLQCRSVVRSMDTDQMNGSYGDGLCLGLIHGVKGMTWFLEDGLSQPYRTCIPGDVNNGQAARIVVKFLESRPELLNQDRGTLVWRALKNAYPCKG